MTRPSLPATLAAAALLGLALGLQPATGLACGESLYRVGKGVAYRDYTAPLPGSILLVVTDAAERELARALIRAGHQVEVVEDPADIAAALAAGDIDIVLGHYHQRDGIEAGTAGHGAVWLPVARGGTAEEAAVREVSAQPLSTDDSIRTFLRAIHRTLKQG